MNIETVEELSHQIADWLGIYGGCKNVCESDNNCNYDPTKPMCCRTGFMGAMEDRIRNAVENEKKLKESGL